MSVFSNLGDSMIPQNYRPVWHQCQGRSWADHVACPLPGSPVQAVNCWRESRRELQWSGPEASPLWWKAYSAQRREIQPREQKAGEDLTSADQYLKGMSQENGGRLCSVVPSDKARGNGHKLEPREFQTNIKKLFLTVRVTEHGNRLLGQVVE